MKNLEAIIFDMDGLMIDTEILYIKACKRASFEYGLNIPDEVFLEMVGCCDEACAKMVEQAIIKCLRESKF